MIFLWQKKKLLMTVKSYLNLYICTLIRFPLNLSLDSRKGYTIQSFLSRFMGWGKGNFTGGFFHWVMGI